MVRFSLNLSCCMVGELTGAVCAHVSVQVWLPELAFRLRRLHYMYPDFVTK